MSDASQTEILPWPRQAVICPLNDCVSLCWYVLPVFCPRALDGFDAGLAAINSLPSHAAFRYPTRNSVGRRALRAGDRSADVSYSIVTNVSALPHASRFIREGRAVWRRPAKAAAATRCGAGSAIDGRISSGDAARVQKASRDTDACTDASQHRSYPHNDATRRVGKVAGVGASSESCGVNSGGAKTRGAGWHHGPCPLLSPVIFPNHSHRPPSAQNIHHYRIQLLNILNMASTDDVQVSQSCFPLRR